MTQDEKQPNEDLEEETKLYQLDNPVINHNNSVNRPLGWTTLEEAKQLVEAGLPVETADMCYPHFIRGGADSYDANPVPCSSLDYPYEMPCWSLGALVQLLPLNMQTNKLYSGYTVVIYCIDQSLHSMTFAEKRETLIEACVEMIILLLNNKML